MKGDTDTVDIEAEYDRELSVKENKELFYEKFPLLFKKEAKKPTREERVEQEMEFNKQALQKLFGVEIQVVA